MPTRFSQFVILIYCYIERVRYPRGEKAFSSSLVIYAFENNYKKKEEIQEKRMSTGPNVVLLFHMNKSATLSINNRVIIISTSFLKLVGHCPR